MTDDSEWHVSDPNPRMYTDPQCGHCGTSLRFEDGDWSCDPCQIYWPSDNPFDEDTTPVFLDDEEQACAKPSKYEPQIHVMKDGQKAEFEELPCPLPASHISECFHPTRFRILTSLSTASSSSS